ncbi:Ger(x)C family spore germination protein [Clostridium sp. MSJ-11]|uniref:Ger(X)C family spore germination protein n=1 Tax=Clostridium mobile TaxID=2841512 RepID=A0ABS6ELP7_9CLOT|nr:Ger(x)C family spore germination protein [Clostridium mobile]MBU5486150.1 Ger(x)C family spore germination protein [Clostridium mobile]
MKIKKIISLLIITFLLVGCWDKVEIDRRTFITTIGIDAGEEINKQVDLKKLKPDEPFSDNDTKILNIIYAFPDISQLGPEKGGVAEEKHISVNAYSMEDGFIKAISKSSRYISFAHSKLVLFGENFFAYPEVVKEVLDYLQREPNINRDMLVIMTEGKVENYITKKGLMEKNIEAYLYGLIENSDRNNNIIPVDLNEFLRNLSESSNAILPYLTIEKETNEVQLTGACIVKDYELKGKLSSAETANVKMLRGKLKGGKKVIYKEGHPIDFSISGMERKIRLKNDEEKLNFYIDIDLEGEIKGYYLENVLFGNNDPRQIEEYFDKTIKEEMESTIKMIQEKYSVDVFGLNDYIKKYHPKVWKRVKDNWEEEFKNSSITVNVNTHIRRMGVTK